MISIDDYLTDEERALPVLPCPFCGGIPRKEARDILHREGYDPQSNTWRRTWTERALYVTCLGINLRYEDWQSRIEHAP